MIVAEKSVCTKSYTFSMGFGRDEIMRIISYGCGNYKPFKEDTSIEVRPLTLIFGKNSSGKSAGLRLLRLILRALSARMEPSHWRWMN